MLFSNQTITMWADSQTKMTDGDSATVTATWAKLGLKDELTIRDLWRQIDLARKARSS